MTPVPARRSTRFKAAALLLAAALSATSVSAQNYQPAAVPMSSQSQQAWAGQPRYGGSLGVNNPYAPLLSGQPYATPAYQSNFMHSAGYGGSIYGGVPARATSNPLTSLVGVFFGEGDFTSRLLNLTIQALVLNLLSGGRALNNPAALLAGGGAYGVGQPQRPTGQQAGVTGSLLSPALGKLNPCEERPQQGPTQAVRELNKDLIKILY